MPDGTFPSVRKEIEAMMMLCDGAGHAGKIDAGIEPRPGRGEYIGPVQ